MTDKGLLWNLVTGDRAGMTHARPTLVPCSAHLAGGEGLEGHRQLGCGG